MIGERDLNILEEDNSTAWLKNDLRRAAVITHHTANVFKTQGAEDDDHIPFIKRGVPSIDIIDPDYGPHDAAHPDGYHTTTHRKTLSTRSAPNPSRFPPTSFLKPSASSTSAELFALFRALGVRAAFM
jgi:hypothetical protein